MRRLLVLAALLFALPAMVAANRAQAAPFTGSISYSLGGLAPLVASGAGSGNSPGLITIGTAGWAATGPLQLTLATTEAPPLTAIDIVMTAPGPCAALPGPCALGGTANALVGGNPFLVVPMSGLGVSGRQGFGAYGSYIDAQAWQTGVVPITVNGVTLTTDNGADIFTTGYDNRAAGGAGLVKLVAPAGLMSTLAGNLPLYVHMTVNFVSTGPTPVPTPVPTPTPAPCPTVVTTLAVSSGVIPQLGATTGIAVTTSAALTVGSTDVKVNFDPSQLQAVGASSSTLSSFTFFIDNVAGTVTTASASFPSDALAAGDPLFAITFTTADDATLGSVTTIFLSDADGVGCKDLAGPVPPIPPVSLPYSQVPGEVDIGVLGDVDCDGSLTPIDASVVLGLFVGNISDGDLPPPCDDPAHRLAISDWALDGGLTPIDASITLGVFVGAIDPFCDTPLGIVLGNCPTAAAMQRSAARSMGVTTALSKAKSWVSKARPRRGKAVTTALSKAKLRVGREWAQRGQEVTVDVTTRRALEVGSTGLSLSYDASALEVVVVESELEGFMYQVDEAVSVIRTASAGLGQELAAGDALMSVIFRLKPDAERGRHRVSVSGELGGPVLDGQIPEPIEPLARSGFVGVRGR